MHKRRILLALFLKGNLPKTTCEIQTPVYLSTILLMLNEILV